MDAKEYSLRALDLTSLVIQHNSSHYTIWVYRRDIIQHLQSDLNDELDYTTSKLEDNPKSYQLW